jgi:hypothetical protein
MGNSIILMAILNVIISTTQETESKKVQAEKVVATFQKKPQDAAFHVHEPCNVVLVPTGSRGASWEEGNCVIIKIIGGN